MSQRIHCYAAGFGNSLARDLIRQYGTTGGTVLDPFVGSGTTIIEALSAGQKAIGIDVDPVACLIARVQTRKYDTTWLSDLLIRTLADLDSLEASLIQARLDDGKMLPGFLFSVDSLTAVIPNDPKIDFWFSPTHRATLATLVAYLKTLNDERTRDIFAVSISSAIVRKWPNTLSLAMDIDHSRPHRAEPEITEIPEQFDLFRRVFRTTMRVLMDLAERSTSWPNESSMIEGKSEEEMLSMDAESVDLILTSPPYVNAIDYPRSHKFSEWWLSPKERNCIRSNYLGLRSVGRDYDLIESFYEIAPTTTGKLDWLREEKYKPKSSKVYRYVNDMEGVFAGCSHVLRKGGSLAFVLANNRVDGRVIPIVDIVEEMLRRRCFKQVSSKSRQIERSRRRYPFGFKGTMNKEFVITAVK